MSEEKDQREGPKAIGGELILPLMGVAYAIYYLFTIRGLPWEAQANGSLIAAALGVLVAILLVRTGLRVARGEATLGLDMLLEPRDQLPQRVGFLALMIAAVVLIQWLGFTLTTFLFMAGSMALLRAGNMRRILTVAAVTAVVAYLFFIALLDTRFPDGPVENLIGLVF